MNQHYTIMSAITNYELRQTMLSFAYLAYTGEGITTSNPEATILENITAALPKITISSTGETLSDWEVVWGPVAYTVPGSRYQDNMMFVVNKKGTSQYVISTRGTNFVSQVDWFLEDFEVFDTMPWPMPNATSNCGADAAISESTSIGMMVQIDASLSSDAGVGLLAYLTSITQNGAIDVCVTGHSLGGVLSNTLGLYLLENPRQWDQSGKSTVSCISFAAPTAGNYSYAQNAIKVYAAAKGSFPGWDDSIGSNLDNVMCNMDGAPLFFNGSNLYKDGKAGALFSIYSSPTNPGDNINFANLPSEASEEWSIVKSLLLANLAKLTTSQQYTQLITSVPFQGVFNGSSLDLPSFGLYSLSTYLEVFGLQAAWQHSCSYPIYLGMLELFDPSIVVRLPSTTPVASPPTITGISPSQSTRIHVDGINVTITGTGFNATLPFANFIVFSENSTPIPYSIVSATTTELVVRFYVEDGTDGAQKFTVVGSSPYFTSNETTFTIT